MVGSERDDLYLGILPLGPRPEGQPLSPVGPQGWTVVATQRIPSGSFVAEYLGEYVTTPEARRRLRHYDLWNKQQQQQQQALKVPKGCRPQPGVQLVGAAVPTDAGLGLLGVDPGADLGADPGVDPGADLGVDPRTDPGSEDLEIRSVAVPRGWGGHALMVSQSSTGIPIGLIPSVSEYLAGLGSIHG